VTIARHRGLKVVGTLAALDLAAAHGLVDLQTMFERLPRDHVPVTTSPHGEHARAGCRTQETSGRPTVAGRTHKGKSGYNKGTIRSDVRYRKVSKDVRRHRLISSDYIKTLPCHGRGREFESRRPRHIFQRLTAWTLLILGAIRVQPSSLQRPRWLSRAFARAKWLRPTCPGLSASCSTPLPRQNLVHLQNE